MSGEHLAESAWPAPFPNRVHHQDKCPGCGHVLGIHADSFGCIHGWTYDRDGLPKTEGCECPLALARDFDPPAEKEL